MLEHVNDVSYPPRALLDLTGQPQAGHGHDVEGQLDEGLGVVEALEEDAAGGHGHLRQLEQFPRQLDEVAPEGSDLQLRLL